MLKLCLTVFHETMGAHKGLDRIGQIDIAAVPGIVVRMYGNMLGMLRGDYMGMSADLVIRILIGISWAGVGIFAIFLVSAICIYRGDCRKLCCWRGNGRTERN